MTKTYTQKRKGILSNAPGPARLIQAQDGGRETPRMTKPMTYKKTSANATNSAGGRESSGRATVR